VTAPERVRVVQVLAVENGYLVTIPAAGLSWCYRTLPEALDAVGRILEPPALVESNSSAAGQPS